MNEIQNATYFVNDFNSDNVGGGENGFLTGLS